MKTLLLVRLFVIVSLLTAASLVAQSPGGSSAGRPAHSSADEAAPTPSAEPKPLPSPPATAKTRINGKTIKVSYNSPSMRGRKIMGELVPYGKVWRTGANPATSFVTAADIMVGTLRVPAGSYTLYTLPTPPQSAGGADGSAAAAGDPWMLILNKQTGQWGTVYDPAQDLGRVPMHAATLHSPQQSMSISFTKEAGGSVQMHIKWENVDEFISITPAT